MFLLFSFFFFCACWCEQIVIIAQKLLRNMLCILKNWKWALSLKQPECEKKKSFIFLSFQVRFIRQDRLQYRSVCIVIVSLSNGPKYFVTMCEKSGHNLWFPWKKERERRVTQELYSAYESLDGSWKQPLAGVCSTFFSSERLSLCVCKELWFSEEKRQDRRVGRASSGTLYWLFWALQNAHFCKFKSVEGFQRSHNASV